MSSTAATGAAERTMIWSNPAFARAALLTIASGTFEGGATAIVSRAALANAGFDQIIVRSAAPVAAVEDIAPTGNYGVVAMPGVPLAAAISL